MSAVKSVNPATAHEWLMHHEAILIDVREPAEYEEVHIAGAHLIPSSAVCIDKLPPEARHKKLIVHCKLGKRGSTACEKLLSENPALEIYNLEGGIVAWENAGFVVKKR